MASRLGALVLVLLLAGCAPSPAPEVWPAAPSGFPEDFYRKAAEKGAAVYAVAPRDSQFTVRVYRAGPLSTFGHDHLVSSRELHGYVLLAEGPAGVRADLYLPLASLNVTDENLSPEDAAATRRNMLDKVLEADRYPFAQVHGSCRLPCPALAAKVMLHGVSREMIIPLRWRTEGPRLEVEGAFRLRHRDFGLVPYSLFGGALRVEEEMDLNFRVGGLRLGLAGKQDVDAGAAFGN